MPKPQKRKETAFETEQTRSLFFTGTPNKKKLEILTDIQTTYTDAVNRFISVIDSAPFLLLPVVKNDKHDSGLRALEKSNRAFDLGCAMSQAAFDDAVTMMSNRYENILREMRSIRYDIFTGSKVLFCMSIQRKSRIEMADAMNAIADAVKNNADFYRNTAKSLMEMEQSAFDFRMEEFALSYFDASSLFRVPHTTKMWVSLSSKACALEEAENICAGYVISITNPGTRGERIVVPLVTSENSVRRINQYGRAKSCKYTITDDGKLRVSVAFKKRQYKPETDKTVGVDTGITDCFCTSDGRHIGTFKDVEGYYKTVVEPSLGELSSLRNKKAKILYFINTHSDLPSSVRRSLLDKVNRLEGMIQAAQEPWHKLRGYYQRLDIEISRAVDAYIDSIDKSTLTVLELLDIREFDKSRKVNGMLSIFARGQLQQKLIAELNWHGYDFLEVEPAYTSQLCPVCFCVDKKNRNGKRFHCTCCGYEEDADVNAARNIRARANDEDVRKICEDNRYNQEARHAALKNLYAKRHNEWLELNKTEGVLPAPSGEQQAPI